MKIAVIGGIGSGKSEVLKVAKDMGISVLSADEINAQLLKTPYYIENLKKFFPDAVVCGVVDKPKLAAAVFEDKDKRELLNGIAHPEIFRRINNEEADPLIVEVPLMLESGMTDIFDEVLLVKSPKKLRIQRLEGRGLTKKRAKTIMNIQAPPRALKKVATYTVENSGDLNELKTAATQIFKLLCE